MIGVFDSGVGGLTVVKEIKECLPQVGVVYLGDTARLPYGTKSRETVIKYSLKNIAFLTRFQVQMVVIACNTASSYALPALKKQLSIPTLGVIKPGVDMALKSTKNKRIGVIGTEATIRSRSYEREIKKRGDYEVFSQSCPLFVPLVEEGIIDGNIAHSVAQFYLEGLKKKNIDTLILGCTHYPLLQDVIAETLGEKVHLISSAKAVAQAVKKEVEKRRINGKGTLMFFTTDAPERFARMGRLFLGKTFNGVKLVEVE
ncbi:MAG: glutamate racemase [Deltaproteobacteria bacterium]|nr:glutamate racemase [Deltaproteobacteria bacterium]